MFSLWPNPTNTFYPFSSLFYVFLLPCFHAFRCAHGLELFKRIPFLHPFCRFKVLRTDFWRRDPLVIFEQWKVKDAKIYHLWMWICLWMCLFWYIFVYKYYENKSYLSYYSSKLSKLACRFSIRNPILNMELFKYFMVNFSAANIFNLFASYDISSQLAGIIKFVRNLSLKMTICHAKCNKIFDDINTFIVWMYF